MPSRSTNADPLHRFEIDPDLIPNPDPVLKSKLSDRLLDYLDQQLKAAGKPRIDRGEEREKRPLRGRPPTKPENLQSLTGRTMTITLSRRFNEYLHAYLDKHNEVNPPTKDRPALTMSGLCRASLEHFLASPFMRNPYAALSPGMRPYPRSTAIAYNIPDKLAPLRESLVKYASEVNLTQSAIIRRALYEYVRSGEPNNQTHEDPLLFLDAWGDQ